MNKIEVFFTPCQPSPPQGYNLQWRLAGVGGPYNDAGNYFISPAIFYDTTNPAGTCYEGFIRTDCRTFFGNQVDWASCESGIVEPGDAYIEMTRDVPGLTCARVMRFTIFGNPGEVIDYNINFSDDADGDNGDYSIVLDVDGEGLITDPQTDFILGVPHLDTSSGHENVVITIINSRNDNGTILEAYNWNDCTV